MKCPAVKFGEVEDKGRQPKKPPPKFVGAPHAESQVVPARNSSPEPESQRRLSIV